MATDYEKKYKEALERAKRLTSDMTTLQKIREFIFPELAESEDERIRKELKEAFEAYDIESTWNGIPIRSIFAWLEKQKEQKQEKFPPYVTGFKGEPDPAGVWKPSEEQMNALYDILHPADTVNRLALKSLYEQLKAL